jgi:hypothetical protein
MVLGHWHKSALFDGHRGGKVHLNYGSHHQNTAVGEKVLFVESKSVGNQSRSDARGMNVLKGLPGETYGVELALTLRILGAALVKLPCLVLLSAQKMKAEGFLRPAVPQPLVLVG